MLRERLSVVADHIRRHEARYIFETQFVYFIGTQVMRALSGYVAAKHDPMLGSVILGATEAVSKTLGILTPVAVAALPGTRSRETVSHFMRRACDVVLNPREELPGAFSEFRQFARESRATFSGKVYRRLSPVLDPICNIYFGLEDRLDGAGGFDFINQSYLRTEYRDPARMPVQYVRMLK